MIQKNAMSQNQFMPVTFAKNGSSFPNAQRRPEYVINARPK
jgi:hypothetical protein